MEKRIYINGKKTPFWIEDTGRLRNEKTKRWLKGGVNKGYHFYSIYFKGKQYIYYTHRLVAEYFITNPSNYSIVQHIDNNRLNNIFTNLKWISQEEHNKRVGEITANQSRPSRQYVDFNGIEMKQFRNTPYYITKSGRIFNISKGIEIRPERTGNYLRFCPAYGLKGKHFLVHRAVWEVYNGNIPKGYDIDHIDNNPHNNSLDNLQMITHL